MQAHEERPAVSDEEIIGLFLQRNEQAVEEADRKYGKMLRKIAGRFLSDERDTEECVNDAYMDAWEAIPQNRPRSLAAFLTTIVRRRAIDRYKAYTRKKQIPREALSSLEELEEVLADRNDTENMADARALSRLIDRFLGELPARSRYIFMSRYYASDSVKEISSRLNVSMSTVEKTLTSMRRSLKKLLESEGYET